MIIAAVALLLAAVAIVAVIRGQRELRAAQRLTAALAERIGHLEADVSSRNAILAHQGAQIETLTEIVSSLGGKLTSQHGEVLNLLRPMARKFGVEADQSPSNNGR